MKKETQLSKIVPLSSTCVVCHVHVHRHTDKIHKIILKQITFFFFFGLAVVRRRAGTITEIMDLEARASKHKTSLKDSVSYQT